MEGLEKKEAYMLDEDAYNKFISYGEQDDPSFEEQYMVIESQEDIDSGVDYLIKSYSF